MAPHPVRQRLLHELCFRHARLVHGQLVPQLHCKCQVAQGDVTARHRCAGTGAGRVRECDPSLQDLTTKFRRPRGRLPFSVFLPLQKVFLPNGYKAKG